MAIHHRVQSRGEGCHRRSFWFDWIKDAITVPKCYIYKANS